MKALTVFITTFLIALTFSSFAVAKNENVKTVREEKRVEVCHLVNDTYQVIEVSESSVNSFLEKGGKLALGGKCDEPKEVKALVDKVENIEINHVETKNYIKETKISKTQKSNKEKEKNKKVTICHRTGSTKNPVVIITVSENAKNAHLKHGDKLAINGSCQAVVNDQDENNDVKEKGGIGGGTIELPETEAGIGGGFLPSAGAGDIIASVIFASITSIIYYFKRKAALRV